MVSPKRIFAIVGGDPGAETLLAALELGLFTELGKGPRSLRQLHRTFALDAGAAGEFLESLVTLGLLDRVGGGEEAIYLNTREGAHFLDGNSAAYIGAELRAANARLAPLWQERIDAMRASNAPRRSR